MNYILCWTCKRKPDLISTSNSLVNLKTPLLRIRLFWWSSAQHSHVTPHWKLTEFHPQLNGSCSQQNGEIQILWSKLIVKFTKNKLKRRNSFFFLIEIINLKSLIIYMAFNNYLMFAYVHIPYLHINLISSKLVI